jgi:oleate hydratase
MHYFVGGGIASLAAAVFLIRDVQVAGCDIKIFEQLDQPGGSLDGSGGPTDGYLVRGGRMFEKNFVCTENLLRSISMQENPERSLWDDILAFNRDVPGSSTCRLVRAGSKADTSLGLSAQDILDFNLLLLRSERRLQGQTIDACFSQAVFCTNFWIMWSTMVSSQPCHSAVEMRRYLKRFMHLFPGFSRIEGILRTRYNQYDSIIAPIVA